MPTASVSCCLAIGTPLRGRPQRDGQLEPRRLSKTATGSTLTSSPGRPRAPAIRFRGWGMPTASVSCCLAIGTPPRAGRSAPGATGIEKEDFLGRRFDTHVFARPAEGPGYPI